MCLGVPGKIVDIYERGGLQMGKIDFGGVFREACLAYVPEAQVGDYTVIHVGFALNVIDEQEALETLALLREISDLEAELGPEGGVAFDPAALSGAGSASASGAAQEAQQT
jgi:hydrogenase expression/formation protein HypC